MSAGAAAAVAQAIEASGAASPSRSREPLHLPGDAAVVDARTMWMPP